MYISKDFQACMRYAEEKCKKCFLCLIIIFRSELEEKETLLEGPRRGGWGEEGSVEREEEGREERRRERERIDTLREKNISIRELETELLLAARSKDFF